MTKPTRPTVIAIDPDEDAARFVGVTKSGLQFFITTPFVPAIGGNQGREFAALFRFKTDGTLHDARIEDLGTRAQVDDSKVARLFGDFIASLGDHTICRINVQPFEIRRFGVSFGLIARAPETDDGHWWVELQPGNYMAFHEPWDSGQYDT